MKDYGHTLTPKQYFAVCHVLLRAEYPHASRAELADVLSYQQAFDAWKTLVFEAAGRGEVLKPVVLDRLYEGQPQAFWLLLKWHEGAMPAGYLNPEARKAQP